jgi:hypothetical protein
MDREHARKHAHASLAYEPVRLKPAGILLATFTPHFVLDFLWRLKSLRRFVGAS